MSEQDHTCEFCYYELFDDKAYPCSRCVCNQPTENMWRPKIKDELLEGGTLVVTVDDATKVGRVLVQDDQKCGGLYYADEPQTDCKTCRHNKSGWYEKGSLSCERCCGTNFEFYEPKDEPQERSK